MDNNNAYSGNINDFIDEIGRYMRRNYDIEVNFSRYYSHRPGRGAGSGAYEIGFKAENYSLYRIVFDTPDLENDVINHCNEILGILKGISQK